jgi:ATP-dependent Clp protease ATP-binding subunit ClpC
MDIAGIAAAIAVIVYLLARQVEKKAKERLAAEQAKNAPPQPESSQQTNVYALAKAVQTTYKATAHPSDVLSIPEFRDAAVQTASSPYTNEQLIKYVGGDNGTLSSLALAALGLRKEQAPEVRALLLQNLHVVGAPWSRYLALHALNNLTPPGDSLIIDVLGRIGSEWPTDDRYSPQFLREFVRIRFAGGEVLNAQNLGAKAADQIGDSLHALETQDAKVLREIVELSSAARVDVTWLATVGNVWKQEDLALDDVVLTAPIETAINELQSTLSGERRRPILLVGEAGVGKRVLTRAAARRLHDAGWTIFEAGANELLAGQMWFGQFEERMQSLVRNLRRRRVLWIVNDLAALILAGRHRHSQTGALDVLLPHLDSGDIVMIGTAEPAVYEKLLLEKPQIRTVFRGFRIHPLPPEDAVELARRWAADRRLDPATPLLSDDTLREAWQLTMQYLGMKASPGNLLDLLKQTHTRLRAAGRKSIESGDLVATLESLTGLPAAILDEREGLNLARLRTHFEERVVGQPEAVSTLVERVAMIKAGLTDPTRPLGVFLFAGPTGTGKTEIAKALAEFLFGSANRMLRIDMSELQSPESLSRLLGDGESAPTGGSLVEQIRRQPFSLVLLDEFEKSHPNVADLFLQLFDDGRLTDRRGVTADFRHALIIMTSNVGAAIQTTGRLGFSKDEGGFSAATVQKALDKHFRKEFLNRIDRIVVFRPLARETMRRILKHELSSLYMRRGLRNRPWALEWDASAIDFLLDKGFTPDMGARPLKRAIDQHVLSPLAMAIVDRSLPDGEQFVYLRSDGEKLDMEFIDAGSDSEPAPVIEAVPAQATHTLRELVASARGTAEEVAVLETAYADIERTVQSETWRQKKEIDLSMTALPEFWRSPDRFEILTKAEYRDRVETGFETARSMMQRVRHHKTPKLVERVAQQLFLLRNAIDSLEANLAWEAFIHIDAGESGGELAAMLRRMYGAWAKRRGMRLEPLIDNGRELLLSVSGFGAYSILRDEQGVHVLEKPRDDGSPERLQVRLRVVPQPHEEIRATDALTLVRAADQPLEIVRRYRELPSPLVRDAVRQWRTGRLDLVLDGNFDVMTGA